MLDINYIRESADRVRQAAIDKRIPCDLDRLLAVDDRRRSNKQRLDALRHESKELGGQMALYRNPKGDWYRRAIEGGKPKEEIQRETDELQERLNQIKQQIKQIDEDDKQVLAEFTDLMLTVPQVPAEDVPHGADETQNVEIRRVGELPTFDFEPKDHVQLGTALGVLDIERGVKLSGSRNYVLCGEGALLHQAVLRLAMDMMLARGYRPMTVPVLVRDAMMRGTGYYPGGEEQAYRCERDELSLVGTAEVPLTSYYGEEILSEEELPKKMVAVSPCFRREAGAAGRDTYGLFRIHWFEKVEQVVICRSDPAVSLEHHQEILANAEAVLQALELPYRVVNVCTGDLGIGQVQKFDLETWMPSRKSYGETHSASRFHDFQARRLNLRYRDAARKVHFCHTLNNTVIASPRILIPLLEIHQTRDGNVRIPKALQRYLSGRDLL
jgi:seryl-tRNA synthetase